MAHATQSFLSAGALSQAQQLANRWPYKPEARPKQKPRTKRSSEHASTLSQTADQLYASECAEYDTGLRSKPPKRLTGEYIRIIEAKALKKLKRYCERHALDLEALLPRL